MRSPPPEVFDHTTATPALKGPHLKVYDILLSARVAFSILILAECFGTNSPNIVFV